MMVIRNAIVGTLVVCATWWATAQQSLQLSVTETVTTHEQGNGGISVVSPVKCGPDGELYAEFTGGSSEDRIAVISEDGQHVSWFGLRQVSEMQDATLHDFAVGASHDVVLLVSKQEKPTSPLEHYAVVLKKNGTSSIKRLAIKSELNPRQIAALGPDNFVVSGYSGSHDSDSKSFIQIFDASGEFVKEVVLSEDLSSKDVADGSDAGSSQDFALTSFLDTSSLQTADDGSAYLMRPSPEGPIFIISPGGMVRRVRLKEPGGGAQLSSVKVNGGTIAADYYVRSPSSGEGIHEKFLTLTDLFSGNRDAIVRYEPSRTTGLGMVCYRDRTFEFLTQAPDGHLQITRAVAY